MTEPPPAWSDDELAVWAADSLQERADPRRDGTPQAGDAKALARLGRRQPAASQPRSAR